MCRGYVLIHRLIRVCHNIQMSLQNVQMCCMNGFYGNLGKAQLDENLLDEDDVKTYRQTR